MKASFNTGAEMGLLLDAAERKEIFIQISSIRSSGMPGARRPNSNSGYIINVWDGSAGGERRKVRNLFCRCLDGIRV